MIASRAFRAYTGKFTSLFLSSLMLLRCIRPRKMSEINKEQSKKTQKRAELRGRLHGLKDQARFRFTCIKLAFPVFLFFRLARGCVFVSAASYLRRRAFGLPCSGEKTIPSPGGGTP